MLHWENLSSDNNMSASRTKVPGGWLVFTWRGSAYGGLTFYPDPDHRWDGTSKVPTPATESR